MQIRPPPLQQKQQQQQEQQQEEEVTVSQLFNTLSEKGV